MSAKQVRKLQALKVSKKGTDANEDAHEDAKESGSDCESTEPKESKACGFAALIGSSDTDSDAAHAHDSQIQKPAEMAVEKGPATEIAAESAPPPKSKKKKKGKKSQVKKTEDSSEGEELLLEAALVQAEVTAAANSLQLGDDANCGNSLAMAKPFFNADRERRRLFKMKPSQMKDGHNGHNSRKGQSLKLRGTTEGHFLHYRRLFIIEPTPDEGWPRPDGCARMVTDNSQCFRIETTPERTKMLLEFASDAASYEPQMVYDFLMDYPFCVEALLVASEMSREGRDHQEAFRLLRRAVYAAECSFNGAFSPFSETQVPMVRGDGCCILSWPRVRVQLPGNDSSWPGWSWLMALWGYMLGLASQGLPRTSLEVCKLILAMTLPYDPTHSLAHLDYFALRAEEYDFLLHFVEHFNPPCALPAQCIMRLDCCLPNFAYSAALAYYLRTDGDACDEASALGTVNVEHLTEPCWVPRAGSDGSDRTDGPSQAHLALLRAMLFFPGTLRSILDNLGISLNSSASGSPYKLSWSELLDRSPLGQKPTLHQQHFLAHALVSDAFVQRCAAFFRGERMLRWLHACAGRLVQMCESSLFEKELLQARKAWSEAPLAVANALANDYKQFSTSEVGPERKAPVIFENAVNTWLGAPAETPPHRPEAQLVVRANSFPKNPAMVRVDSSRVDDEWLSMKEAEHQDEGEAEAAEATETKDPEAEANVHAEAEEDGEKDESVLDKTVLSDPLSDEEREVLTKLRQHETEVEKVRSAALELRSKASQSAVDFRSFTEAAQQVEDSTKVDPEILQRDAVSSQLEWPAKELKFARVLVAALDAWEKALAKGKEQLTAAPENAVIGESITALLESFQQMQVAQREAQASGSPAVRHADIGLTGKETGLRPLLEALLDKAQELEQLESFKAQLQDDEVRMQMLSDLKVQLPDSHVGKTEPPPLGTEDVPTAVEATDPVKQEEDEHLDPQKLWRAVHTGDESIVKAFVARKACDGTSRDASGHSIFWHAISFNHHSLAQYFWESFPPGSPGGIEVDEVHYRKGDTLLHLLCLCRPFNAEAAALFKRVAAKAPPPVFQKQNALGLTFLDIAIDTLNFWVLTFVLKNFQVPAKALLCNSRAPLRRLFKVLRPPMAPQAYQAPGPFPEHFRVAAMLQQDPSGLVPYADVAFDVGPERQGVATGRFLAHRVVVVAQSPVLFEVLEKMPLTELPKEKISAALIRVDERISQKVWRSVLQFMYQGTISVEHCSYLKDAGKCVELLRACLLYKLPEPLLRLALSHLFRLLPSSSPTHALQVFALCASDEHIKNKELSSVRDGAAWVLLHQAHIMFVDIEAPDLCEILSKVVRCLESTVFENPDQPAVMEDLLSYSFHGVPQDILSQTLSTTRRVSAHFQTKEDMLSQSMASVSSMQSWPNQRGASRVVMY